MQSATMQSKFPLLSFQILQPKEPNNEVIFNAISTDSLQRVVHVTTSSGATARIIRVNRDEVSDSKKTKIMPGRGKGRRKPKNGAAGDGEGSEGSDSDASHLGSPIGEDVDLQTEVRTYLKRINCALMGDEEK